MIRQDKYEKSNSQTDPVLWLVKWLLLGNVLFLATYVICPGLIFERILFGLEGHLYNQYKGFSDFVESPVQPGKMLAYSHAESVEELVRLSHTGPVLLYGANVAIEAESEELKTFKNQLPSLCHVLIEKGIMLRWININLQAPSHYEDAVNWIRTQGEVLSGWYLLQDGKIVDYRDVTIGLIDSARQIIGVPFAVIVADVHRVELPTVTTFDEVVNMSRSIPLLLFTCRAEKGDGEKAVKSGLLKQVLPAITKGFSRSQVRVAFANVGGIFRLNPIAKTMVDRGKRYCGCQLYRDGNLLAEEKVGDVLYTEVDLVAAAKRILEKVGATEEDWKAPEIEVPFWLICSPEQLRQQCGENPVLMFARKIKNEALSINEFKNHVLAFCAADAHRVGLMIVLANVKRPNWRAPDLWQAFETNAGAREGCFILRMGQIIKKNLLGSTLNWDPYLNAAHELIDSFQAST
jgi:hypothetical protein